MTGLRGAVALMCLLLPLSALAEDEVDGTSDEPVEAPDDAAAAPPADDGGGSGRRRRLTGVMVGLERVGDDFDNHLSAPMGGIDVAFGHQFSDTIGLYVPAHLSMGAFQGLGTVAGVPAGLTGTLAVTAVVDATFVDRVFVGGGAGVGILNNPTGPCLHLRAGGYPLMSRMDDGSDRRRGLQVAADLRLIFAQGFTATYPALSIGYASF